MNLMDGDQCPDAILAHEHIAGCADCHEWKFGMDTMMTATSEALEEVCDIDISAAVMARLPKHPPAGTSTAVWPIKRLLACWLAGASLIVIGLGAWMLITGTSLASLPVIAYGSLKGLAANAIIFATIVIDTLKPILNLIADAIPWLKVHASRISDMDAEKEIN